MVVVLLSVCLFVVVSTLIEKVCELDHHSYASRGLIIGWPEVSAWTNKQMVSAITHSLVDECGLVWLDKAEFEILMNGAVASDWANSRHFLNEIFLLARGDKSDLEYAVRNGIYREVAPHTVCIRFTWFIRRWSPMKP